MTAGATELHIVAALIVTFGLSAIVACGLFCAVQLMRRRA